ncbi:MULTISPECIES: carbohydrate ABC transporter permease [Micromonospora]|uniref:Carbohydrate ABC transporter membrane protein 2, CUT1 family n=1 Tax=Micromonospora yangpuensis TaxID=683228 RepID=A0A1C6TZJ9_9ACTN|nr:carbohydrate ABC transporter permease [Micromonospora yangpuensis]GGM21274.1 sugar ABC transporter permease [Micromonospora yangpuensis]SCL47194.1 carbohydrate ABC transporter membrane protein 2, CUT1 family [Micromonospora yangpuensis]
MADTLTGRTAGTTGGPVATGASGGRRPADPVKRPSAPRQAGIYLGLVAASLFAVFPLLWGLSTSLKPESTVLSTPVRWIPETLTLENYRVVLFDSQIPLNLLSSVLVSVTTVGVTLLIAVPAAYSAARFRFRGKAGLLFFILMTSMVPGIAILVPLYYLAVRFGLYDTYLVMIIIYSAWQVPTIVWILRGFFESIPVDIEEAGRVDGTSAFGAFFRLVLPLAKPGLGAAAIITFVYVWNDYLIASTFVSDPDLRLISVGLYTYLTQYGTVWGQLTAAVMVTLLPMVIAFVLFERRLVAGLSAGASKG